MPYENKQTPAEYLDQIAPKKRASMFNFKSGSKFKKIITISVGLILLSVIIMITLSAFGSNKKESSELLAAKLNSISDTISQTSGNIKSTSLKATNSTLEINIANEIRDLEPIIANYGIKISKLSSSATKKESNTNLLDLLEDARLNATFDRTYAREMAYQLELLINLLDDIKNSNKDSEIQTFISSALTNLEPIQQSFADFSQADS